MTNKTLIEILTGTLSYSSTWGIYAERIDGKFKPDSPARFGQQIFNNGGLLDSCEFFCNNESATDSMSSYLEGTPDDELEEWMKKEAAEYLIDIINAEPR